MILKLVSQRASRVSKAFHVGQFTNERSGPVLPVAVIPAAVRLVAACSADSGTHRTGLSVGVWTACVVVHTGPQRLSAALTITYLMRPNPKIPP